MGLIRSADQLDPPTSDGDASADASCLETLHEDEVSKHTPVRRCLWPADPHYRKEPGLADVRAEPEQPCKRTMPDLRLVSLAPDGRPDAGSLPGDRSLCREMKVTTWHRRRKPIDYRDTPDTTR